MSIPEESDGNESDDQSYSSDEGIIDGVPLLPTKREIVNQLTSGRAWRKKQAAEQEATQGGLAPAMRKNRVEVWNGRKSQEHAARQAETTQESDQVNSMIDISDNDESVGSQDDERSRTSAEWQLNVSRLFGEINDGTPPHFTQAETEFMLVEGAKNRVKYTPAPGARRKAKQQQR